MNYEEESKSKGEVTIGYLATSKKIIYIETKNFKLQRPDFDSLVQASMKNSSAIHESMKTFLYQSFKERVQLQAS
jgi:hypothetical protein